MTDRHQTSIDFPDIRRWTPARKSAVVTLINSGAISIDAACSRYDLSTEEIHRWQSCVQNNGVDGLRVTRIQDRREGNKNDKRLQSQYRIIKTRYDKKKGLT